MITFQDTAAQGDILIRKIDRIPADAVQHEPVEGQHIVAHSETGHHHVVPACGVDFYHAANDPMIMYLAVNNDPVALTHLRGFDTHRPITINPGDYEIRRQREWTPEGWRKATD